MLGTQNTNAEQNSDAGFQGSVLAMLEWLADRDPIRAASIINDYLDELAEEMSGGQGAPAKSQGAY